MPKKKDVLDTILEVHKGEEQPSEAQIRETLRAYVPTAIEKLVQLCNSNNQAISLGALKTLMNKVAPDLKATTLTGENGETLRFIIQREGN